MVGCRHGAKNTLVNSYNYLCFAERLGVKIDAVAQHAERTVTDVRPLGAPRGRRVTRRRAADESVTLREALLSTANPEHSVSA